MIKKLVFVKVKRRLSSQQLKGIEKAHRNFFKIVFPIDAVFRALFGLREQIINARAGKEKLHSQNRAVAGFGVDKPARLSVLRNVGFRYYFRVIIFDALKTKFFHFFEECFDRYFPFESSGKSRHSDFKSDERPV